VNDTPENWTAKAAATERNLQTLIAKTMEAARGGTAPGPVTVSAPGQVPAQMRRFVFNPATGKMEPK